MRLQRGAVQQALAGTESRRPQKLKQQASEQQSTERLQPPAPDWYLDHGAGRTQPPIAVHARGCWALSSKAEGVSREVARKALAHGDRRLPTPASWATRTAPANGSRTSHPHGGHQSMPPSDDRHRHQQRAE
ncbi:DUF6233 domain-containing protein [Streptomyces sp. NPDC005728]|uniref:DUF6233 domain-containing protein n=1 Tax=Streptomyces sp. NPDC005728 TaxID=3157054 RepID=UPI0033E3C4DF